MPRGSNKDEMMDSYSSSCRWLGVHDNAKPEGVRFHAPLNASTSRRGVLGRGAPEQALPLMTSQAARDDVMGGVA